MTYNVYTRNAQELERDSHTVLAEKPAKRVVEVGSLVPEPHNELSLTYVTSGNGIGEIKTVIYKNNTSTVATLTLSYNSEDKLIGVVRS